MSLLDRKEYKIKYLDEYIYMLDSWWKREISHFPTKIESLRKVTDISEIPDYYHNYYRELSYDN